MYSTIAYRAVTLLALALAVPTSASAQGAGATLTLEEAQALAQRNNPDLAISRNARRSAGAALRSAYGSLLPGADFSFTSQFREGGSQPINGVQFETGDIRQSQYWLGVQYRLSGSTLLGPSVSKANLNAADADLGANEATLRTQVAQQYLASLKAQAQAELQDTLVVTSRQQLELARARAAVGAGTQLDVTRAQVTLGQAEVQAIQAHNTAEVEKLRLFSLMGVTQPPDVALTSTFPVTEPTFNVEELLQMAQRQNPTLEALRARDRAADVGVKQARSQYLPSLSLSTGWGGYTYENTNPDFLVQQAMAGAANSRAQCFLLDSIRTGAGLSPSGVNCGGIQFTDADRQALLSSNEQFPFDFQKQPFSLTATVSIPIFDGFTREQRVQEAVAARSNAQYRTKARELQLRQEVTAAYLTLRAAQQTVTLQQQNAIQAREELRLAEERYRVGASTFLDVTNARASVERAETERIAAIYDYHSAFAALESAVGRPLR
ncbi:MAG TPA: TolC family protein [Gemmatimonadaceae bacterium]|nr:TolC family protein [Gemmatimonadaceae bacterium]